MRPGQNRMNGVGCGVMLIVAAAACLAADPFGGEGSSVARHRLYTPPDPAAPGGIKGTIARPAKPLATVLAIPPDTPERVYEAKITEPDRRGFLFQNLPAARYDLVVVYADEFFEGLQLTRGENTLTEADREKITAIVTASDPFFTRKVIHRMAGATGRGNAARCVVTLYRDRETDDQDYSKLKGYRRTFKLIWLKDVGPGWQVVQKRDLYPVTVEAAQMNPLHHLEGLLAKIRVTDQVRDLGMLELGK
ncbi:MAG: hypothetical protein WCG36_00475 [bacterium]